MAIAIIGQKKGPDEEKSPLPPIDVDVPPPGTAPELSPTLDESLIRSLLSHRSSLIRSYAVEQAMHLEGEEWSRAILPLVADEEARVASDAIRALEERRFTAAADAIVERFKTASHEVAATAAGALGELAPEKLLEAVTQRKRLDDEAYAATATALACIGSAEVADFLGKALNRAGALAPERRGALYSACLLSGSPELASRIISLALEDSKKDEPEGATFPTRSAFSALASLPIQYSRKAAGLELYDLIRTAVENEISSALPESDRTSVEEALRAKKPGAAIAALEPILKIRIPKKGDGHASASDYGNIPERRFGLLQALIARSAEIDTLDLKAATVFLATAAYAAQMITTTTGDEGTSAGLVTLAKALEFTNGASELAHMSEDQLTALFKDKSEHQMRRVVGVLTHEQVRHPSTLRRLARAILAAGHGEALFDAASEVDDPAVHDAVVRALKADRRSAEKMVVGALTRTPTEAKVARLALEAAGEIRTQRVALAIARKFEELRAAARSETVRAMMVLGDPRFLELLIARAYPDEPEELAWSILMQVHGRDGGERLARIVRRADEPVTEEELAQLRIQLRCKRCKEVLSYGFERALLDVESKDPFGDPAFVGDVTCKACGSEGQLEPTQETGRILTSHLLEFVDAAKRRQPLARPRVVPAETQIRGKRMGFSEALRKLDEEIKDSPSSIRARLHRARLKLVLKRRGVEDDADRVLELDPRSSEAHSLKAGVEARAGRYPQAMAAGLEALRLLIGDPPSRLYDADQPELFKDNLEDFLVQMEMQGAGVTPEGVDLGKARARRAAFDNEMRAAQEAATRRSPESPGARPDREAAERERAAVLEEAFRRAGRNDPCPCGSGKKFKKCHGKGG